MTRAAVRVAIAGSGGRMGQTLLDAVLSDSGFVLTGALEVADSPILGRDPEEILRSVKRLRLPLPPRMFSKSSPL